MPSKIVFPLLAFLPVALLPWNAPTGRGICFEESRPLSCYNCAKHWPVAADISSANPEPTQVLCPGVESTRPSLLSAKR